MLCTDRVSEEDLSAVRTRFPLRYSRAMRCVKAEDGLCVIAAGVLLWRVLGVEDESVIQINAEGRPHIEGGPEFSLSHSGGRCVLAVDGGPVGVDIEKLDESSLIAAPAALTEEELLWIAPSPLERFHLLWTRKESVYKAVGGYKDPKEIPSLDGRLPEGLFVKSALLEGFALSVCAVKEIGSLEPININ